MGGGGREFAKNLQRERSFILFCFVGVAFLPSLRRALFSPSLFSLTLVENRPEQEHRKSTESPSRLADSLLAAAAWNSFTRGKQRTGGDGGTFAVELG